jgi:hypothetical protein
VVNEKRLDRGLTTLFDTTIFSSGSLYLAEQSAKYTTRGKISLPFWVGGILLSSCASLAKTPGSMSFILIKLVSITLLFYFTKG